MTAKNLAEECQQRLRLALEDAFETNKGPDERIAFVYRHATTIQQLAEDALHLESEGRHYSSVVVVRSMLECVFNLVAAVKHSTFAVEKLIWEVEEEAKKIRRCIEIDGDDKTTFEEVIRDLQSLASSLRQKYNITTTLNWNTFECAKAADLLVRYRNEYFLYSKAVHATTSGMISREKQIGQGYVLQTVLLALLYATGYVVQLVPTKNTQAHVDATTTLMGKLTDLADAGHFHELDGA